MAEQAPFYIFTAFIFAYAVNTLKMNRDFILAAVMAAAVVSFVTIPLSGHISDRIGRRKMYLIGVVATGLFGFLYFGMVDTAIPSAVFIAIVLSLIPHDIQYGPQAALIAESFTPRLRYSGSSLGYQLASIIAGGPAPLIAAWLYKTYQTGYAIAIYIAACAVISAVATAFMTFGGGGCCQFACLAGQGSSGVESPSAPGADAYSRAPRPVRPTYKPVRKKPAG